MTIHICTSPIFSPIYGLGEPWVPERAPAITFGLAERWLQGSQAAGSLIEFLHRDPLRIHVLVSQTPSMPNKFWIPEEVAQLRLEPRMEIGTSDVLVTWNPITVWHVHQLARRRPEGRFSEKGINKMGQVVRSEIVLIHEFGHVRQWLLKHNWYYSKWRAAMDGDNRANLDIEDDNLRTVESVVAKQLGQGVRWHYENNC